MALRICKNCEKEFYIENWRLKDPSRGKFCSINCNNKYHSNINSHFFGSSKTGENSPSWKGGLPKCITCENTLSVRRSKYGICKDCLRKRTGSQASNWRGGITNKYVTEYVNRKRNSNGNHTAEEWENLKLNMNFMCLCCKRTEPEIKLTKDHIIPLVMGGSNNIENIQPLCLSCNCRKHSKYIDYREEKNI